MNRNIVCHRRTDVLRLCRHGSVLVMMPALIAILIAAVGGCGSGTQRASLSGQITFDGSPVAEGVIRRRLAAENPVICTLYEPECAALAKTIANTRSAAAVDLWGDRLAGAVVVIGNAPTALFRLLERLQEGAPRPAAILGFPIGFVGAAESKEALIEAGLGIPYVTLRGRLGGSAMAAAALNALGAEPA